jgi:hypothetical protein
MAITHNEVQVQWNTGNNNYSLSAGSTYSSDAVSINATATELGITCKADNNGTPASGDVIDWYIRYTDGDPDGVSTDEYGSENINHATYLGTSDTNDVDPAIFSTELSSAHKGFYIMAVSGASSNGITISATCTEVRAS